MPNCEKCGADFEKPRFGKRRFCSDECKNVAYKSKREMAAERDREKNRVRLRNYYLENKADFLERAKVFAEENPEQVRGFKRKYSQTERGRERDYEKRRRALARKRAAVGHFTRSEFNLLCVRYHNRCLGCGEKKKLEADHVVPLVCGGSDSISNIQPLCRRCNATKAAKTVDYRPIVTLASIAEEVDFNFPPMTSKQENMETST